MGASNFQEMAARRLTDIQKKDLVHRFRSGDTASSLAQNFGCSANTVTRVVRSLLSSAEYSALKASRAQSKALFSQTNSGNSLSAESGQQDISVNDEQRSKDLFSPAGEKDKELDVSGESGSTLALDDSDDFADKFNVVKDLKTPQEEEFSENLFHELVPLVEGVEIRDRHEVPCKPFSDALLPESVYMLVEKSVELDSKPLKAFSELGIFSEEDQDRQAVSLFSSPRSARRACGRNQRVIRIPDTSVFTLTIPYLLAKSVTRLVLDGKLISLDD